jgi:large subunit ribosomal protein L6
MSRIGRLPVEIPPSVTVTVDTDNTVHVKGPKGELQQKIHADMKIGKEGGILKVERPSDQKMHASLHGLSRTLIANMVQGVTAGYEKKLQIIGVGYKAQMSGSKLVLNVGYSHPVEIDPPKGITLEVPSQDKVIVKGIDKQLVGAVAAKIREVRSPEPYKGKGIRYEDEHVARKEGKTAKK